MGCITLRNHRMEQCCCGCSVRTGSLIIGILEFFGTLASFGSQGTELSQAGVGSQIATAIIGLIICSCLLFGILKDRKTFLLPYIVIRGISIVIMPILIVIIFIMTFVNGAYILFVVIVLLIIFTALSYYFWKCVWSFYLELQEAENPVSGQP